MIDRFGPVELPQPQRDARPAREPKRSLDFEEMLGAGTDAVASDSTPANDSDKPALEIDVRDNDGRGQTIVLPWRLMANDALSQWLSLNAPTTGTVAGEGVPWTWVSGAVPTPDAVGKAGTAPIGSVLAGSRSNAVAMPVLHAASTAPSTSDAARHVEVTALPATLSQADPWQARLLRWMQGDDRQLMVRLRDYRLGEGDKEQLVARLVAFARENGLQLQRVVVNARELWRAPR